jgi:serine/threonine-protein kinase
MEPRSIAIGLVAVIAAFAAAFAISSSGGEKTATAGPGTKAETIKVAAPAAVTGVAVGGSVPALKAEKKKKPAKKESSSSNESAPSTSNSTTPPAPQETNPAPTQPSNPAPSNPAPSNPAPSNPAPSKPKPQAPISGGGEDG